MSSLIPNMVGVSSSTDGTCNEKQSSLKKLSFGFTPSSGASTSTSSTTGSTNSPGVMAKRTRKFPSPLGLFTGHSRLFSDQNAGHDDNGTVDSQTTRSKRLGIARASYTHPSISTNDDVDAATTCTDGSSASHRIGILPPSYDNNPDLHLSPLNIYKKVSSPTPNLVRSDDSESDGDGVWPPKFSPSRTMFQKDNFVPDLPSQPEDDTEHKRILTNRGDGLHRFLHQQTAQGHYLVNSQPLETPSDGGIKYCLKTGKDNMKPTALKALASSRAPKTRANIISVSSTPKAAPVTPDDPFKVFLLLIQPQSKIFEIIQVFYSPSETTVQNLLEMIPINATEPALGSQEYFGLCRPTDGSLISIDMMASFTRIDKKCARIVKGEMLVAIPKGYSGSLCARISSPILSNPKVKKLLERSDPLAPKRKKKRSSSHRKVIEIETVREETASELSPPRRDPQESLFSEQARKDKELSHLRRHAVRNALKSAAIEAASTNAQVERRAETVLPEENDSEIPVEMWKTTMSLSSQYTRSSSFGGSSIGSIENTAENKSLSSDILSAYGSLDAEFLDSLKRMPRRKARPRRSTRRQNHRKLLRSIALILVAMLIRYLMVRNDTAEVMITQDGPIQHDDVFGFFGFVQVMMAFTAFVKLQRYVKGKGDIHQCTFVKFFLPTGSSWSLRMKGD